MTSTDEVDQATAIERTESTGRVSSKHAFLLKDSPQDLIDAAASIKPQGRSYSKEIAKTQPGSIKIEEVVQGMKYAALAITDDKDDTLRKVGKSNPWHIDALKIITGSEEEAHKPLSHILSTHMDLAIDTIINVSGVTPGGHPLDTQGYIAHNDEVIVLAFRCTTSFKDWMTNLNTTSSEWELEEDLAQGFSGYFSGLAGYCCNGGKYKPRVHTGFYNNFLATTPLIKEHVDPLLGPDQPPRKFYVVGHSLGAGIATLATCYFLLEHDFANYPQKLVSVTAGSPRACQSSMREVLDAKLAVLRPLDKAVCARIVRDKDVVPTVPPSIFGFKHVGRLVFITDNGDILINPKVKSATSEKEMKSLLKKNPEIEDGTREIAESRDESEATMSSTLSSYARIPQEAFRDHMPQCYLEPLLAMFEKDSGIERSVKSTDNKIASPVKKRSGFLSRRKNKNLAKHDDEQSMMVQTDAISVSTKKARRKMGLFRKKKVDPATISTA